MPFVNPCSLPRRRPAVTLSGCSRNVRLATAAAAARSAFAIRRSGADPQMAPNGVNRPTERHHHEDASECRYRLVAAGSWWPATRCNRCSSTPASAIHLSAICRSPCRTSPLRPRSLTS